MDGSRRFLWGLLLLWLAVYGWSFVAVAFTPPTGDGFTRGLNRIEEFGKWQVAAATLAVPVWVTGRRMPSGSAIRWLSRAPAVLALLLVLLVAGLVAWARLSKPAPVAQQDPRPVTVPLD